MAIIKFHIPYNFVQFSIEYLFFLHYFCTRKRTISLNMH